jgi:hypothetical protein
VKKALHTYCTVLELMSCASIYVKCIKLTTDEGKAIPVQFGQALGVAGG